MRHFLILLLTISLFTACKKDVKTEIVTQKETTTTTPLKYAKGFSIVNHKTYKEITVTKAWPKSTDVFKYIVVNENEAVPAHSKNDVIIQLPIHKLVVMSTTNIPSLEYLGVDDKLVGFPNTDYISSEKTKKRVDNGEIRDLNNDLEINMELLLELQPELVIGFSVNGNNKSLNQIKKFGIPIAYDGAWTEEDPLGRAEWIKFIAAFFNKEKEANTIFNEVEKDYLAAKDIASEVKNKPIVFSGSMFKDIWSIPGGKSFVAKYLHDANTDYLYKNTKINGSHQFNFENVLVKAQNADLWIGAGSFKSKADMSATHKGYSYFKAFKNNNIYTYTNKIGEKGGLLYYELGPLRPDLILKDIIKISHPELLKDYELFFFKQLN